MAVMLMVTLWMDPSWAQTKIPHVGVLLVAPILRAEVQQWFEPFRRTLSERSWIEGKNFTFEFRDSAGDPTRLAEPAAELLRLKVDVLFAVGPPSRAAFAATRVAIDFDTNPLAAGYAESYSHRFPTVVCEARAEHLQLELGMSTLRKPCHPLAVNC